MLTRASNKLWSVVSIFGLFEQTANRKWQTANPIVSSTNFNAPQPLDAGILFL
jgi:hypothetical protein